MRSISHAKLAALLVALAVLTPGCGAEPVAPTFVDSGIDAAIVEHDASVHDGEVADDAAVLPDAATIDAGSDAGPEPCSSPGATESVACGSCGTVDRFCTAEGTWAYGTCEGEGECAPGTERTGTCGMCGESTERCTAACEWEPTGTCSGEGECAPGTRTRSEMGCPTGQTREVLCTDACAFEATGTCEADACPTPGASETVACGMCGTRSRFCTAAHVWSYGPCGGEGVCAPGTTEPMACGRCGTRAARCTAACAWDTSAACSGEGVCTPGESSRTDAGCPAGQTRALTCGASCSFEPGACEIDECVPGTTTTAACGMCGTRTRTCNASRRWVDGPCTSEGVCMPGTSSSQACGRCGTQSLLCNTACTWVASGTCGGEGTCTAGSVSGCTTSCGSTGTQTCSASCTPGVCTPPIEVCNGADDDCDGAVDDSCTGCVACAGSTVISGTGGRYTVPLVPGTRTGSCGGAGSEGLLTLTTTSTSDVFLSTHGAGFDTVLYARQCSCSGSELACNDDADGQLTSVLRFTALPPGTYTFVVDTEAPMSGSVVVDAYVTSTGTAGDRCGNPRLLAAGTTRLTGDSCAYANDLDTTTMATACSVAGAGAGEDVVYYFYVPTTRTVTFDGCGTGFSYDGTLYVRSACNATTVAAEVACDDDSCDGVGTGACTSLGYAPRASVTLAPGLYYLVVDGYSASGSTSACSHCGPYDLTISGL